VGRAPAARVASVSRRLAEPSTAAPVAARSSAVDRARTVVGSRSARPSEGTSRLRPAASAPEPTAGRGVPLGRCTETRMSGEALRYGPARLHHLESAPTSPHPGRMAGRPHRLIDAGQDSTSHGGQRARESRSGGRAWTQPVGIGAAPGRADPSHQ
jgi:hypothetical protein